MLLCRFIIGKPFVCLCWRRVAKIQRFVCPFIHVNRVVYYDFILLNNGIICNKELPSGLLQYHYRKIVNTPQTVVVDSPREESGHRRLYLYLFTQFPICVVMPTVAFSFLSIRRVVAWPCQDQSHTALNHRRQLCCWAELYILQSS